MPPPRLAFVAADSEPAQRALTRLAARYPSVKPDRAEVIVALGGDGFMLQTLHRFVDRGAPIFGMHRGTVGFLLNAYRKEGLVERIGRAVRVALHPLRMTARTRDGRTVPGLAFNEISLIRQGRQAAKIRILVDGVDRLPELICDGVLVATPAGSTAYNFSAHGPIVPLGARLLALTPISAFRPRRWRGALLPDTARVTFEIIESDKRPISATADDAEVRDVIHIDVRQDHGTAVTLLFDPEHSFEERVLKEQFAP